MFFYLAGLAFSAQFAILYAGSCTFRNYRHQADIYTIYNQLLARGFTPENIGLYAYDDIATDPRNPFIGQVFHSIDHKTFFIEIYDFKCYSRISFNMRLSLHDAAVVKKKVRR